MTTTLIICIAIIIIAFLGIIVGWAVADIRADRMKSDCLRSMYLQERHKLITIHIKESFPLSMVMLQPSTVRKILERRIANQIVTDLEKNMTITRVDNPHRDEATYDVILRIVSPERED